MKNFDLVSVYITTKNRLSLLKRAVNSVSSQTYRNIELIVVDDGSNDCTYNFCQNLYNDRKIIYLRNEISRGACAARNMAINVAKGKFITGLDDDDFLLNNHIESLAALYQDEYAAVAPSHYLFHPARTGLTPKGYDFGKLTLSKQLHYNCVGNQIYTKTERLREIQGFDENLNAFQDIDCWIRLSNKFGAIYKSKKRTYAIQNEEVGNRISSNNEVKVEALEFFLKKHSAIMSAKHIKTNELFLKYISGQKIGKSELIFNTNFENYKRTLGILLRGLR